MSDELKNLIEEQKQAVADLRAMVEAKAAAEVKGKADALHDEAINKVNARLDELADKTKAFEAAAARESKAGIGETEVKDTAGSAEYKQAMISYLRKGDEELLKKALSVNSDPDGGYTVTPTMSNQIIKSLLEISPMRQLASVETISTDAYEFLLDGGTFSGGWAGEAETRNNTDNSQFGKGRIDVHEIYAQPTATQKLIDDSAVDIEAWTSAKVSEYFSKTENTAFISGNGVGQPRGILSYASGTTFGSQIEQVNSGNSSALTADGLISLFYALKSVYAPNASFLMSRSSIKAVRLLKDGQNNYLWQPSYQAGRPDTLLGAPVLEATDMPTVAANALAVAFGDFRQAYKIIDRVGIRILRDPFTSKPFVKFYTTKRVGGAVVNTEALKIQKVAS
jgi:HK97 family phage major capsid protein